LPTKGTSGKHESPEDHPPRIRVGKGFRVNKK
jgi:hypothetical protein